MLQEENVGLKRQLVDKDKFQKTAMDTLKQRHAEMAEMRAETELLRTQLADQKRATAAAVQDKQELREALDTSQEIARIAQEHIVVLDSELTSLKEAAKEYSVEGLVTLNGRDSITEDKKRALMDRLSQKGGSTPAKAQAVDYIDRIESRPAGQHESAMVVLDSEVTSLKEAAKDYGVEGLVTLNGRDSMATSPRLWC